MKEIIKNRSNRLLIIISIIYLVIWALSIADYYRLTPGDELGYGIVYFYFLLPFITLILSICIGKDKRSGYLKWLFPVMFGFMYISPLITLSLNGENFFSIFISYYDMIINGIVISLIGVIIGIFMRKMSDKKFELILCLISLILFLIPVGIGILSHIYLKIIETKTENEIIQDYDNENKSFEFGD